MWRCIGRRAFASWLTATIACTLCLGGGIAAQQDPPREFVAVERWLASDQTSREGLDDASKELLVDAPAGFVWLGAELHREAGRDRRKGLEGLLSHCTLEFLRRQRASGVRFAGQFDVLRPMQPEVGEFLFGLLLDTPQWYPTSHRVRLVPALRDVQPGSPGEPLVGRVAAVAENVEIEPEPLRIALACMLWQWGHKQLAQERIDALVRLSTEGDAEDRIRVLLELADLQYELRDYRNAAATHRSVQAMAKAGRLPLKPIDYYQAACAHALIGDVDRAFDALLECAALQASPSVDSSLKLERHLFQTDPEIESLRRDARFAAIMAKAFGAEPAGKSRR